MPMTVTHAEQLAAFVVKASYDDPWEAARRQVNLSMDHGQIVQLEGLRGASGGQRASGVECSPTKVEGYGDLDGRREGGQNDNTAV
jgi:hypothetical protein